MILPALPAPVASGLMIARVRFICVVRARINRLDGGSS